MYKQNLWFILKLSSKRSLLGASIGPKKQSCFPLIWNILWHYVGSGFFPRVDVIIYIILNVFFCRDVLPFQSNICKAP